MEEQNITTIKKYFRRIVPLGLFLLFLFFVLNIFSYFDPVNFCHINIGEKDLGESKGSITKAIKEIKKTDNQSYKDLCRYVDEIIEDKCFTGDPNFPGNKEAQGCYIKGSRTIYLPPSQGGVKMEVEDYVVLIKKHSQKSKEFWQPF